MQAIEHDSVADRTGLRLALTVAGEIGHDQTMVARERGNDRGPRSRLIVHAVEKNESLTILFAADPVDGAVIIHDLYESGLPERFAAQLRVRFDRVVLHTEN